MHKLLQRQLKKYFGESLPDSEAIKAFIEDVNNAYQNNDKYFQNLEHALEVTNEENSTELNNFKNTIDQTALVLITNINGSFLRANDAFYDHVESNEDQLRGQSLQFIFDQNPSLRLAEIRQTINQTNTWQGEIKIANSKKIEHWFNCKIVPHKDYNGKTQRYMATLVDISDQKTAEKTIQENESKYQAVTDSIKEIIFQTNADLEITFVNKAWPTITGFNKEETIGKKLSNFISSEDKNKFALFLKKARANEQQEASQVFKFESNSNQIKWLEIFIYYRKEINGLEIGTTGTMIDITEKHINQQLLVKSHVFQRALLDSANYAILSTNELGSITTINEKGYDILNIKAENFSSIIVPNLFQFHLSKYNENKSNFVAWISSIGIKDAQTVEIECSLQGQTQEKYIFLSVTKIASIEGDNAGYLFIANDITKKKEAEIENAKLNTIIQETHDFVVYYDDQGLKKYSNQSYKEIREENGQETQFALFPPWAEVIIKNKAIPLAKKNGSWNGELAIYNKKGHEIPVHILIITHNESESTGHFTSYVMRDITQRKEYETRILQSEKRNRDLINYSQAIICTHDLEGKIHTINPAGCNLLGYQMEELVGHSIIDFMPEHHREKFKTEYLPQFSTGKISDGLLTLQSKQGKKVFLLYKNFKVNEANGETYIIGFAQDITERILAENELRLSKLKAEESSRTKEMFLANMSHEIRTPMNGIVGLTNLLLKSNLTDKQQQFTNAVKQSAENLLVIINDILDFSKMQAGKLEITNSKFDLAGLVYNLHQTFTIEANKKRIQLKTSIEDGLHTNYIGDHIRLNQILVNLLSNAIKFTNYGFVSLHVKLKTTENNKNKLRFEITDTGIGIETDNIEKIFQSFTQANADTTRKYGGTGLGLSIVKNLLTLLESKIEVTSTYGGGSTFAFELELEKYVDINIPSAWTIENSNNKLIGIKILLAEDNKVNQLFAQELINEWGAQLDIADNGKIAIDYLKQNKYDIILMDIQMPEMSGIDATKIIRSEFPEPIRSTPIIAVTANAMKGDNEKYIKIGMNDVIFKPFESHELFNIIEQNLKLNQKCIIVEQPVPELPKDELKVLDEIKTEVLSFTNLKAFSRGKISFIVKMIKVLKDAVPEMSKALEQAIEEGDKEKIRHYAHKLIPNMNMVGNLDLEVTIKWIEDNALTLSPSEIKVKYLQINNLLNKLELELQDSFKTFQEKQLVTL